MKKNELLRLEKLLGVKFHSLEILNQALIHRSWINEHREEKKESNERLEFLGDAVLEFWVTKTLFFLFPHLPEGSLTNIRSHLVCTENLAKKSRRLSLHRYLLLGKGEEQEGGREKPTLLADAFEAVVGAIFVDQGIKQTEKFLAANFLGELKELGERGDVKDAKTLFQELTQKENKITPHYRVIKEEGPEHKKVFQVAVYVGEKKIATGKGRSKKEAEEEAAKKALTLTRKESKIHP